MAVAGAPRVKLAAAPGFTVTLTEPVMLAVAVSVAVTVCAPAFVSVTENVP